MNIFVEFAGWVLPGIGKGLVLITILLGIGVLLEKRTSAVGKRLFWIAGFATLLTLTVLNPIMPKWLSLHSDHQGGRAIPVAIPDTSIDLPSESTAIYPPVSMADRTLTAVGVIYLIGFVFLSFRLLMGWIKLFNLNRNSILDLDDEWKSLAIAEAENLGLSDRKISIYFSKSAQIPMTWGIFRPKCAVPYSARNFDEKSRRFLVRHEFSHIKNRDAFFNLLGHLVACLHWPNPLVWIAFRRLRLAQELVCDEMVTGSAPSQADYAELLINVTKHCQVKPVGIPTEIALNMAGQGSLKQRIDALLDPALEPREIKPTTAVGTISLLTVVCIVLSATAIAQEKKVATSHPVPSPEKKTSTIPLPTTPMAYRTEILTPRKDEKISAGFQFTGLDENLSDILSQKTKPDPTSYNLPIETPYPIIDDEIVLYAPLRLSKNFRWRFTTNGDSLFTRHHLGGASRFVTITKNAEKIDPETGKKIPVEDEVKK